jgi:aminoglycoside phosphotransferase (APT) family kinase protein
MTWDWSARQLQGLERFLGDLGLCRGPVTTRKIGDGHSNLTFLVDDGYGQVVVRRPPPPPTPPGAHDVLREAALLTALRATAVPVPDVLGTARAGDVLDVPLYVMDYVDGPVVTTCTPAPLDNPRDRSSLARSLVDTLAALHSVDWRASGLEHFGRPAGFNQRHLHRMARLVANEDGAPPEVFETSYAWLAENVPPESGAAIVHNDFRLGNMILAPDSPGRVAAVLDWELATVGDPLFDLGYLLASYPGPHESLTPTAAMGTAALEPGYPRREELAERYARITGCDLGNLRWYMALALWKLAVLYEYGRRRASLPGGDPYYADPGHVRSFLSAVHGAAGLRPVQGRWTT